MKYVEHAKSMLFNSTETYWAVDTWRCINNSVVLSALKYIFQYIAEVQLDNNKSIVDYIVGKKKYDC